MNSGANPISRHLRARKPEIASVWESLVRAEVPQLARLDRTALVDHLPEFIEGLARWLDGDTAAARAGFSALAEGHALQRLGYGIDLVTLSREYMLLRSTILRELMVVPAGEQTREWMLRINEGIDAAVYEAVRRYDQARNTGLKTLLVRVDMGVLAQQAAAEHSLAIDLEGDLSGMWDPAAIVDVLAAAFADANAVSVREADDHEAVIVTARGAPSLPLLPERVRDRMIAHGGRLTIADRSVTIEWPRSPLAESPHRV